MTQTRLTSLEGLPPPDLGRAGPHLYRRLGARVLIADESGRTAVLSEEEYRRYLAGVDPGQGALGERLARAGFLRHAFDFDAAAAAVLESGTLRWRGPERHLLLLEHDGRAMSLETARAAADFAFSAPGPVTLEFVCEDVARVWPAAWFLVQYSRRRAEWSGRALSLVLRAARGADGERADFLRGHRVLRRCILDAGATPPRGLPFAAESVLLRVGVAAKDGRAWARFLASQGVESALLEPARLSSAAALSRFLAFYAACLDCLASQEVERPWREERAAAFLARRSWSLPGMDLLGELAYAPDGGVYSSETGLAVDAQLFRLGALGRLRWSAVKQSPLARAALAASMADNQPLCGQCTYRGFCALPPSRNYALQGTVWGQTPSSLLCRLHMGILDIVFLRFFDGALDSLLARWGVSISR